MFPPFSVSGIGVHSGTAVSATVSPGQPGSGIVFRIRDTQVAARPENLATGARRTRLARDGAYIDTAEHFLAIAIALDIPDIAVSLSAAELPILDGSAAPWIEHFPASVRKRRPRLVPISKMPTDETFTVTHGRSVAEITPIDRDSDAYIEAELDLSALSRPPLTHRFYPASDSIAGIAAARTFAFSHEIEAVRAAGLARGGSLQNTVVLTPDGVLNPEGLRFFDEPARHKVLDALGDLALLAALPRARILLRLPGHALNHEIVRRLSALG